jgi:hypothetical protein
MRSQKPVTEKEWLDGDISRMVVLVRRVQSIRKLQLFFSSMVRILSHHLATGHFERESELLDQIADGRKGLDAWEGGYDKIWNAIYSNENRRKMRFAHDINSAASSFTYCLNEGLAPKMDFFANRDVQIELFRDLFGNPFRPITFDPSWQTSATASLAQSMYDSRDFAAMPVLADALEEAGCRQEEILGHCRGESAPHVRGCWVVDLVLGKA